jgi:DNA helicase II / ATP-dependent DNA helicase PcrA
MDRLELITSGLNEPQLQAVTTTEGYVRVAAGAGSGKTKALANRYAYIVEELGISPGNILCITFTNKAAQEMKRRIRSMVSPGNVCDFVCTYHSFCVKFLRDEIHHLYLSNSFVILDEEDQKGLLKEIYEELKLNVNEMPYRQSLEQINFYKKDFPEDYIQFFLPDGIADITEIHKTKPFVELFFKKQLKLAALDYEDLLEFTLYILKMFPEVKEKWQNRVHYILVDETQDNNLSNWMLADILSEKHKNLFIVGDPDQAIYEWRGAKPEGFLNFDKTHNPCTDIIMDENYRSTPNILDVANCVIKNNKNRIDKNLFTRKKQGAVVIHFHAKDENEEGKWICETIKSLIDNGASLPQIAILYRASYISRFVEQSLIRNGFKYVIFGGIRFFERKEVKDALSYLRLIGFGDDLSFLRIINTPSRKFGDVTKKKLQNYSDIEGTNLFDTLKAHLREVSFNKESIIHFVNIIESSRRQVGTQSISDILDYVLKESGLRNMYRIEGDDDRLENIEELMHSITLYEETNIDEENITLVNYLQDIALYTNIDYKEDLDFIKLMTIHQSKGLEFPYVFVAGMSEGIFPNHRAIREKKIRALEEERRLAYVAITRAEKALFLSESEGFDFSTKGLKYPSRFLFEIKKEFCVIEGVLSQSIIEQAKNAISQIDASIGLQVNPITFHIGENIDHPIFGYGIIQFIDDKSLQYLIKFEEYEDEKPISFSYKKLRLVEES